MAARSTTSDRLDTAPADYVRFCDGIRALAKIDLSHYRRGQMERRLRTFAERQGASNLDDYLQMLRRDPAALDRFRDRMTINVSELFRNPDQFSILENDQLPVLAKRANGSVTVWSAGCSYGAEPYTLAILLRRPAY